MSLNCRQFIHMGLLAMIACGLITESSTTASAREPQRWALLIGINDYVNAEDLQYCVADQIALKEQLIASGYPSDHIFLMYDDAKEKQYLPVKTNIEQQLKLVLAMAEQDDVVIVAFSGHGAHLNKTSYLCPSEGLFDEPDSLVSLDKVYTQLTRCAAAFKLVIVDACRNDPRLAGQKSLKPRDGAQQFAESLRPPEGVVLLNSCAAGEVSYEESDFRHGVFMNFVINGLKGEADKDQNGVITLAELSEFAGDKTKTYVARKKNDSQRPFLRGDLTTEALGFSLGRVVAFEKLYKNNIGMELVLIPAGEFLMGTATEQLDRHVKDVPSVKREASDAERPQHRVKISREFYMGKYEVTLKEFLTFYHEAKYKCDCERDGKDTNGYNIKEEKYDLNTNYRPWSWGFVGQSQKHPVVNITWNDAKAFCQWLSKSEGRRYRLPTDAEWEYACRAGTTTRHPAGDQVWQLIRIANLADKSASRTPGTFESVDFGDYDDKYPFTAPVGSFAPNNFGLYDMIGNVSEYCEDVYKKDAYAARSGVTVDPIVAEGSVLRARRSHGWDWETKYASAASRSGVALDYRCCCTGFRVVMVIEDSDPVVDDDKLAVAISQETDREKILNRLKELYQVFVDDGEPDKLIMAIDDTMVRLPDRENPLKLLKFQVLSLAKNQVDAAFDLGEQLLVDLGNDIDQLNNLAWIVLNPDRDTKADKKLIRFSLTVAIKADDLAHNEDANLADTLAKAYFDNGQIANAVKTQERALQLAQEKQETVDPGLTKRLSQYKRALDRETSKQK